MRGLVLVCALALGRSGVARAQDAPAAAPEANAAAAPAREPSNSAEPSADQAPAREDVAVIGAEQTNNERIRKLTLELDALRHERAHTSTLGPWLLTSAGIAVIVVGLGYGIGRTASCRHSCSGPFWPGWTVVAGTTITTAGLIWLVWKRDDIAELELRKSYLERELQNLEWNRASAPPAPRAALSWRLQF